VLDEAVGTIVTVMPTPPFEVEFELDGWTLFWAELELSDAGDEQLVELRRLTAERARTSLDIKSLSSDPTVAALRKLFREAGTDPTRYRPSSEALLRRLLKGDGLPAISPMVDINNCLSAELAVPCCVMAGGTFESPLVFRSGKAGESYQSLRGPFNLEGRPVLCDGDGPLDTPITGNERVKVTADTHRAWLVAYLPAATLQAAIARDSLERLVHEAPVVVIHRSGAADQSDDDPRSKSR
jgi:DNA/RNA-binding domain of Phe-tRNA-synthetase-like protein